MPRSQEDFLRRLQGIQQAAAADQAELEDYARTGGERSPGGKLLRGAGMAGLGALGAGGLGLLAGRGLPAIARGAAKYAPEGLLRRGAKMHPRFGELLGGMETPALRRNIAEFAKGQGPQLSRASGRTLAGLGALGGAVAGGTAKKPLPEAKQTEEALQEAFEQYPEAMMYLMKGGGMDPSQIKTELEKSAQLLRDTSARAQKLQQERDAALEKVAEMERENRIHALAQKMEEKNFWADQTMEEKVASLRNSRDLNALEELVENQGIPIKVASVTDEYRSSPAGMKRSDLTREELQNFIHG